MVNCDMKFKWIPYRWSTLFVDGSDFNPSCCPLSCSMDVASLWGCGLHYVACYVSGRLRTVCDCDPPTAIDVFYPVLCGRSLQHKICLSVDVAHWGRRFLAMTAPLSVAYNVVLYNWGFSLLFCEGGFSQWSTLSLSLPLCGALSLCRLIRGSWLSVNF